MISADQVLSPEDDLILGLPVIEQPNNKQTRDCQEIENLRLTANRENETEANEKSVAIHMKPISAISGAPTLILWMSSSLALNGTEIPISSKGPSGLNHGDAVQVERST
jgi:hypothetical protein